MQYLKSVCHFLKVDNESGKTVSVVALNGHEEICSRHIEHFREIALVESSQDEFEEAFKRILSLLS